MLKDSLVEHTTHGSFIPHGRDDILIMTIRKPEHLCVRCWWFLGTLTTLVVRASYIRWRCSLKKN